ncbi:MAG TPA: hypothetical protein PLH46_05040 [Caldisericia bacterium]|nr:hypothetical protein [Caldisericia bacterium]
MSFKNKTFKEIKTGNIINIIDSYENIAISDDRRKFKTNDLTNPSYFEEVVGFNFSPINESFKPILGEDTVDPTLFFENQSNYDNLFNKIKEIPIDNIRDDDNGVVIKGDQIPYSLQQNVNAPRMSQPDQVLYETSEDDAKSELLRKYSNQYDMSNALVQKQNEALERILDPNKPEIEVDLDDDSNIGMNSSTPERIYREPIQKLVVESPVVVLFKSAKRSVDLDLSVKINNKIPRLDFIEMMEDSYEESIIDWLSNSIANEIISDISDIKKQISDKIKVMIKEKNGLKDSSKKEVVKKEVVKKPIQKKEPLKKSKPESKDSEKLIDEVEN